MKTQPCHCCGGSGEEYNHQAMGAELRGLRLRAGISLTALAGRLKCSPPYLSDLEKGKRNWRDELVERYRKGLK